MRLNILLLKFRPDPQVWLLLSIQIDYKNHF
jgi:hypothetical protein